jgi:protein O-mannosyl-transferase
MQNAELRQVPPLRSAFRILHSALLCICLLIVTAMVFAPAIDHKFIGWDDQAEIYFNPDFNPVTWQHLCENFTHTQNGLTVWMPLTYFVWGGIAAMSHQAPDKQNISLDPTLFHAACLVFHLFAVALCFLVLRRLLKQDIPAILGAALFALHPLQVEPVAWASGMYTVLSGAFSLAAIYTWLRSADANKTLRRWIWFAASTLLFIAAMLTKPSAIVLPAIIAAIHLIARRISPSPGTPGEGRGEGLPSSITNPKSKIQNPKSPHPNLLPDYREKGSEILLLIVLLLLWIPLAINDLLISRHFQPAPNVPLLPLGQRFLIACDALTFYIGKLFVPIHLVPDYGRWPAKILSLPATHWMWIAPTLLILIAIASIRRAPRITAAIAIFLLALAPFLGFVRFDYQFYSTAADRYAYLAMLGPALLLGAILARWPRWPIQAAAGLCLFALIILSVLQIPHWQDTQTLFTYTLTVRPDSLVAHRVLALEDLNSDPPSAEQHFQAAIALRPDDPTSHYNYAILLEHRRDLPAAIVQLKATVALNPDHFKALDDLGVATMLQKNYSEAKGYFEQSIQAADRMHADFPPAHQHLALDRQYLGLQ